MHRGITAIVLVVAGIYPAMAMAIVPNISVEAQFPRGTDQRAIAINIVLDKVEKEDATSENLKQSLQARLKFFLKDFDTKRIKFLDEQTLDDVALGFELSFAADPVLTPIENDALRVNLTASLNLKATGDPLNALIKTTDSRSIINLSYKYTTVKNEVKDFDFVAVQQTGVPNQAPQGFQGTQQHHGISLAWTAVTKVPYIGGTEATPTGTSVFVIDVEKHQSLPADARALPAILYNKDLAAEKATNCSIAFAGSGDSETCEVSCGAEDTYLLSASAELALRTDIRVIEVGGSAASASLTKLEPDKKIAVVAQFEPDGVKRSNCLILTPKINSSLTELNGASDAVPGNPACFIATAAYGTPQAAQLSSLRWFRDRFLLSSGLGRRFVRFYYSVGPELASLVAPRPWLRALVRACLAGPVWLLSELEAGHGRELALILAVPILLVAPLIVLRRRLGWR